MGNGISIHALREEGDGAAGVRCSLPTAFLSTPSARRATALVTLTVTRYQYFYPRPPRGGRPRRKRSGREARTISIHALREEGDSPRVVPKDFPWRFLSTPSARRATSHVEEGKPVAVSISIHALREEGDVHVVSVSLSLA